MTQQGPAVEERDPKPVASCRHHWIIAAPNGATSKGTCKLCGETREFRNSTEDSYWDNDGVSSLGRWRSNRGLVGAGIDDEF
ncbi:MAG TPA: hypothetical protein VIO14_02685 [Dehalococcoidia bacterium]